MENNAAYNAQGVQRLASGWTAGYELSAEK